MPPLRWPDRSYSLLPLRAALVAEGQDLLQPFSAAAYRMMFVDGRTLTEPADVLEAAAAAGLDTDGVAAGIADPAIKARLWAYTDAAIERKVAGVPTVAVGGELSWGDDMLEAAAAAVA